MAARIARYAVLAVFLCLGLAGLAVVVLLWRGQPLTGGVTPFSLLIGLLGVLALAWIWSVWVALMRGSRSGLWTGGAILAGFTAFDLGLPGCAAGTACEMPPAPQAAVHAVLWAAAAFGAVLALREARRRAARGARPS